MPDTVRTAIVFTEKAARELETLAVCSLDDRLVPHQICHDLSELSAGQMIEDIRLAVEGRKPVGFFGRLGGMVPTPEEIETALYNYFNIK